jgi:hypothetical protein
MRRLHINLRKVSRSFIKCNITVTKILLKYSAYDYFRDCHCTYTHCQKNAWKIPCSATCDSGAKANDTDFSVSIYQYNKMDFPVGGRKIPCEKANLPMWLWIDPLQYLSVVNRIFPLHIMRWQCNTPAKYVIKKSISVHICFLFIIQLYIEFGFPAACQS